MGRYTEETFRNILRSADIEVGGDRDWDIQLHDPRTISRCITRGSLGLGESYMDGWWECAALDQFCEKLLSAGLRKKTSRSSSVARAVKARLINAQSRTRSRRVAEEHYDLPIELYDLMLDKRMQYTCAYWHDAQNLEEAQLAKLDLVCKKLHLRPGMKVLELGGGFGGLARHLAAEYGCEVVTHNISKSQAARARSICDGLPVTVVEADYRDAVGDFDRVVSIGMCEHIGRKNYPSFIRLVRERLRENGLFLLHTIGSGDSRAGPEPWLRKYIFPGATVPIANQLTRAFDGQLTVEDWQNIGPHYDPTLMAWHSNFVAGWDELKGDLDERFFRMWSFYLLCCAGSFRARHAQLWQILLSKNRKEPIERVR